ncbi:MAG: hypothetical protein P1Q69_10670 [Candidatus Thorarchaeota archaeon]|nr:hypothetical protein [Candidatus Thorarchaeota archaeon]
MAEEFVSRLIGIEKKIDGLGETLMRMITILGSVKEIKSDLRVVVKEEINEGIMSIPQAPAPLPGVTKDDLIEVIGNLPKAESGGNGPSTEEISQIVKAELAGVLEIFLGSLAEVKEELQGKIDSIEVPAPIVTTPAPTAVPVATPAAAPIHQEISATAPVMAGAPVSADRGMQVADQLENIIGSLKMGCKAGDVLEILTDTKTEIMRIVPSDPIMVKIDRWTGIVNAYSKRHELSAKDTRAIKKEIQEEIPKYRPA